MSSSPRSTSSTATRRATTREETRFPCGSTATRYTARIRSGSSTGAFRSRLPAACSSSASCRRIFPASRTRTDELIDTIETPNGVTGDAAAAYFLEGSQTKLRAHGGNSYRAPSTYERFGGGGGYYYGDPRLEPSDRCPSTGV